MIHSRFAFNNDSMGRHGYKQNVYLFSLTQNFEVRKDIVDRKKKEGKKQCKNRNLSLIRLLTRK